MLKKIYFDEQGNVGVMTGNVLPLKEGEKLVCDGSTAEQLGIPDGDWITTEDVKNLPNGHAIDAYNDLKR